MEEERIEHSILHGWSRLNPSKTELDHPSCLVIWSLYQPKFTEHINHWTAYT